MTAAFLRANRRTWTSLRKHRNYRIFFSGQVVSVTGTWMQNIAAAWLVLELTGSPVAVGLLMLCQFLPATVLGLFSGVLVDRLDVRRTVIATQAASMLLAAALAAVTLGGVVEPWMVYLLTGLRGISLVVDHPARQAFTFQLVGPAELPNAVALNAGLFNGTRGGRERPQVPPLRPRPLSRCRRPGKLARALSSPGVRRSRVQQASGQMQASLHRHGSPEDHSPALAALA